MLLRRRNPYYDHPLSAARAFFLGTTLLFLMAKVTGVIALAVPPGGFDSGPPVDALTVWTLLAAGGAALTGYATLYLISEQWDRLRLFPWAILIDPSANLAVSLLFLASAFMQDRGDRGLLAVAALAILAAAIQLLLACRYILAFHSGAGNVRSFPLVWQDWATERQSRHKPGAARRRTPPAIPPLTCSATCNRRSS